MCLHVKLSTFAYACLHMCIYMYMYVHVYVSEYVFIVYTQCSVSSVHTQFNFFLFVKQPTARTHHNKNTPKTSCKKLSMIHPGFDQQKQKFPATQNLHVQLSLLSLIRSLSIVCRVAATGGCSGSLRSVGNVVRWCVIGVVCCV